MFDAVTLANDTSFMLSRIQFAANISFHILFPTINIALCWILVFFKVRYNLSQDETWLRVYRFWVRIFALTFAIGVVSGITMSFQFGTNWPGYMETVGNIAGPLLGYEVMTAFFLEASFLSIMLFGMNRVSNRVHTLATILVAIGTSLSAFWILSLDSWMQTPAGIEMIDGVAHVTSWLEVIFNPSMPYRLMHMLLASGLTAAFLISGISAYRLLRGDNKQSVKHALNFSVALAAILIPIQMFIGDLHGLNTLKHQPAKIAAMEGVWQTDTGVPLLLFALPDQTQRKNHFEIKIPNMASLILTHDSQGEIQGLNDFVDAHPPVAPVFFSFRIMIAIGILMWLFSWLATYQYVIKKRYPPWLLKTGLVMTFSGWIATLAGWYVTEIGRQPFLVTGILRTKDAVTTTAPENIVISLTLYILIYGFLLVAYIRTLFVMANRAVILEQGNTSITGATTTTDIEFADKQANTENQGVK
ncbi:cytochrome bd-I ubiquinol oxidase subunit 1 apoprotein [Colwellia chukchiensis]|uniref:Cytochrome bd-I ubiquinol oxidase subunit 1 apoprotein n=1 Tax=Colwellia chukchiensis TaxID=641665 RepID=A0A1H7N420_9GAMM|nr:cytochrome ubiquinol oxidase subunit I [Colwellia chukchiensis]SEL18071.1 cytochrome bd-I ubiquinol oxidase subunit 1 apoprotein [Colwellia chukchiensis]